MATLHHLPQARAKNRHLNLGLQAELYVRTGTYDRPKNTLAIDSACAPLDSVMVWNECMDGMNGDR